MRKILLASAAALLLQACTSTLDPKGPKDGRYYTVHNPDDSCGSVSSPAVPVSQAGGGAGTGETTAWNMPIGQVGAANVSAVSSDQRFQWTICNLRARAYNAMIQSNRFENSGLWRDLPLIGGVAAVAGIVLFGKRDGGNLLDDETDAIEGIGLASGTLGAFAGYLDPDQARTVLRQASLGYQCMATHGDLVLSAGQSIEERRPYRRALLTDLNELEARLADSSAYPDPKVRKAAEGIRGRGRAALDLYDVQSERLRNANTYLHSSAWHFGYDLMVKRDREAVDVGKLITSIQAQSNSIATFGGIAVSGAAEEEGSAKAAVEEATASLTQKAFADADEENALRRKRSDAQLAVDVARYTRSVVQGLINVEALVLGFDTCGASALAGAHPTIARMQTVKFE